MTCATGCQALQYLCLAHYIADVSRRPLFERYPRLRSRVPHRVLGDLWTPTRRLHRLSAHVGGEVWVKLDDRCAEPYGGNKSRKLEFSLGAALHAGAGEVVTAGYVGSNHCLATAVHARRLALRSTSLLISLPSALRGPGLEPRVAANLTCSAFAGSRLVLVAERERLAAARRLALLHAWTRARRPVYIPPGASDAVGALGYVNAGLELVDQVLAGELPRPGRIYVPFGTMGTAVGLALGLGLGGLRVPITAVTILDPGLANRAGFLRLFSSTLASLRRLDRGVPELGPPPFDLVRDQLGRGYGHPTRDGRAAVRLAAALEGLVLEPTYGGKAFAALLADLRRDDGRGGPRLFWHTYDGRGRVPTQGGAARLPPALRAYVPSSGSSGPSGSGSSSGSASAGASSSTSSTSSP